MSATDPERTLQGIQSRSPSYLGALLIAGLHADQIGHVLELVGWDGVRQSSLSCTIDKQLGLLFRKAARVIEISFCNPGGIELYQPRLEARPRKRKPVA